MPETQDSREPRRLTKGFFGVAACEGCGAEFRKKQRRSRFCSRSCEMKDRRIKAKTDSPAVTCERCRKPLIEYRKGKRFCSKKCHDKRGPVSMRCRACEAPFAPSHGSIYCSDACRAKGYASDRRDRAARQYGALTCKCCGNGFVPRCERKGGKTPEFCSQKCSNAPKVRVLAAVKIARASQRAEERRLGRPWSSCSVCGVKFRQSGNRKKYCSNRCYDRRDRLESLSYVSRAKSNARVTKECPECGESFSGWSPGRLYCSPRCGKVMAKRRRKAMKKKAFVENVGLVFLLQRDDGICQICLEPVDLLAIAPDPRSPSIDHVVPLSKGGKHSKANTQLAHFLCNAIKGDSLDA